MTHQTAAPAAGPPDPGASAWQRVVGRDQARQALQGHGYQINVFMSAPPSEGAAETGVPPVAAGHRQAGSLPPIWNLAARNPGFTGRENLLQRIHAALTNSEAVPVVTLRGFGGVGKTQLVIEYVYRHASEYDIVWWISSERPDLAIQHYSALGTQLGPMAPSADSIETVKSYLRGRDRWLLIFDNAVHCRDVRPLLPGGAGHVLITSRSPNWTEIATTIEIDVLTRPESTALLTSHHPRLTTDDADILADALGDLPLALVQACGFLTETGTSPREYLHLLRGHTADLLGEGRPPSYPLSLAAAVTIATERLRREDPAAVAILRLCSFLAPEPVPTRLITATKARLGTGTDPMAALIAIMDKPVMLRRSIGRINEYALARVSGDGLHLHRLTLAVLRDRLTLADTAALRRQVHQIVVAANPGDPALPRTWPEWAALLPHILELDPATSASDGLRDLGCHATWYLIRHGDTRAARHLSQSLHECWLGRLGPDDRHTLWAANNLAWAWYDLGRFDLARALDQNTFDRRRRLHGADHPDTLMSANNLGNALHECGEYELARASHQDTLDRRRRVLGEDHPHTLATSGNLARALGALGHYELARTLHQETLDRRRRVLGDNHPDTLRSANGLGLAFAAMGHFEDARDLHEDTLNRRRGVLGLDHLDTLASAEDLAVDLSALGEHTLARRLREDTLTRRRRILGSDHPDTTRTAENLAADIRAMAAG